MYTKEELNRRKEILKEKAAKFDKLKDEGRWAEAWTQLLDTLNYADDSLKYSLSYLKNLSEKTSNLNQDTKNRIYSIKKPLRQKKMVVIPRNPSVH